MSEIKQVIVMRADLNMRKGKMIAQGAHASMSFLVNRIKDGILNTEHGHLFYRVELDWINGNFVKICVKVNSEQELLKIKEEAENAGLDCYLITDSGLTEFKGIPTNTCLAIGPDYSDKIDKITGHLTLL